MAKKVAGTMNRSDPDPEFVVVGQLSKPHGTSGEILVWPLTDRPDSTFQPDVELRISDEAGSAPQKGLSPVRVEAIRPHRKGYLVRLEGVGDRNQAELLRGRYLLRRFAEVDPLEEGEIFYHQLLGLLVVTTEGLEVGRIREVYELEPAFLLEVEGESGGHLIPFTQQIVVGWSAEDRRMVIDPPAGLLDL